MKSIKRRLVGNFVLVIIITVSILEIFLINAVKRYYYNSMEKLLSNQIKFSSEFYTKYFASSSLEDNIIDNVDVFWQQTSAEVQILDLSGNVLMDSIGVPFEKKIQTADFKKAVLGQTGKWTGKVDYASENAMAVSCPLVSGGKTIGVLRFVTSLTEVDKAIDRTASIFILVGIIVVMISGIVSIFLSDTIIKPLKSVTAAAEKMAAGELKTKSIKKYDDEIGKLSDTLNYMAQELLKKEKMKDEFISSISHELRTPLTSIKGWAVTLRDGDMNDKVMMKDGLQIIENESDRLTIMVEDLLDFSRFESGKITLNIEKLDIADILVQIKKQLSPRAEVENIRFKVDIQSDLPPVMGDENRLKQVFINILDNAFKFSNPGGDVSLSASCTGGYISIIIKDKGCGILPEDLPYVKEKFYKGKNAKSKNGLGLSISDEIVKLHKGSLDIKSEYNSGTEAIIRLPAFTKGEDEI